jgi:hypothetical protein
LTFPNGAATIAPEETAHADEQSKAVETPWDRVGKVPMK